MADIIAQQEQTQRSPNWQNHLAQLVGQTVNPNYGGEFAGQDTQSAKEMKSRERMHAADIAQRDRDSQMRYRMHAESMALQKWSEEQRWSLAWAEFDAYKKGGSGGGTSPFLDELGRAVDTLGTPPYLLPKSATAGPSSKNLTVSNSWNLQPKPGAVTVSNFNPNNTTQKRTVESEYGNSSNFFADPRWGK